MYNPEIHHRRSIRLRGYDYSQEGFYFVTICVQSREKLFGNVIDGKMILNDAGQMITKWCLKIPDKFPDILMDIFVIMPNHFHGIIVNTGNNVATVGAHPRVRPDDNGGEYNNQGEHNNNQGEHVGSPLRARPDDGGNNAADVRAVIQWFKTMTTNEYIRGVKTLNWQPFEKRLWQRNYYEHIIRNDESLNNTCDYIETNPDRWPDDELYTE